MLDVEKLAAVEARYQELTLQLADATTMADQTRWQELLREHARLEGLVLPYRQYLQVQADLEAARLLEAEADRDTQRWVAEETARLKSEADTLEHTIRNLLIPRDPRDERNVILEIRAGAGGDEAALFAADLARMYTRFAERQRWKTELLSANETGIGGYKELVLGISGRGVFSLLKFESGVHRVQRVPATESSGRIHTSTATVAVLPEVEEVEVEINPDDLDIDTYRSSGAGGQHVNKTESAIRITHRPSGIVVACQDERSQHKNRERAMKILRAKLYELAEREQHEQLAADRRSQVGTGDRSQKIRTYNFPQSRVTDHRIGLTVHNLEMVLDGDLDELLTALRAAEESERLQMAE